MRKLFLIAVIFFISINSFACRFTIRDIGYTRLNIETYYVRFEVDTVKNQNLASYFRSQANNYSSNANITYKMLHTEDSKPLLSCINNKGEIIIQKSIVSRNDINTFFKYLFYSPIQKMMYNQIGDVFAFVIGFYDEDDKEINGIVDNAFEQFKRISPNLDKKVSEYIMKIVIPKDERKNEKVILNALGINPDDNNPVVVVIYGRGRLADDPLVGNRITTHNILNQLVTLGTDCECGIDLSPLLKRAIPFNWNDRMSQIVAKMLDIDIENPMVLIEMSSILSKEPLETGKSKFSAVPQTIDLDKELNKREKQHDKVVTDEDNLVINITYIALSSFVFVVLVISIVLFRRKWNKDLS